ncbi:hypothetical protein E2C01_060119 [Portunus trituberculatus]|uniref:Uncharacterized protein n=1 Tax=Portunus trituberculatus TaxID=210409 RepID=A0A5B7H7U9_PORTR|nr:hypothetical protein [Portunus trituberculatus]
MILAVPIHTPFSSDDSGAARPSFSRDVVGTIQPTSTGDNSDAYIKLCVLRRLRQYFSSPQRLTLYKDPRTEYSSYILGGKGWFHSFD